jgi:hypothetical protein
VLPDIAVTITDDKGVPYLYRFFHGGHLVAINKRWRRSQPLPDVPTATTADELQATYVVVGDLCTCPSAQNRGYCKKHLSVVTLVRWLWDRILPIYQAETNDMGRPIILETTLPELILMKRATEDNNDD